MFYYVNLGKETIQRKVFSLKICIDTERFLNAIDQLRCELVGMVFDLASSFLIISVIPRFDSMVSLPTIFGVST